MLMELNESCEDYGMKINIIKTKAMVIGRKPKKIIIIIISVLPKGWSFTANSSTKAVR